MIETDWIRGLPAMESKHNDDICRCPVAKWMIKQYQPPWRRQCFWCLVYLSPYIYLSKSIRVSVGGLAPIWQAWSCSSARSVTLADRCIYIGGLVQYCSISSALAIEMPQCCTKPSIWRCLTWSFTVLMKYRRPRYFSSRCMPYGAAN